MHINSALQVSTPEDVNTLFRHKFISEDTAKTSFVQFIENGSISGVVLNADVSAKKVNFLLKHKFITEDYAKMVFTNFLGGVSEEETVVTPPSFKDLAKLRLRKFQYREEKVNTPEDFEVNESTPSTQTRNMEMHYTRSVNTMDSLMDELEREQLKEAN